MAIDPRISLAVRTPQVSQALDIFERTKQGVSNRKIAQAQEARAAAFDPLRTRQAEQAVQQNDQIIAQQEQAKKDADNLRISKSINDFWIQNKQAFDRAVKSGDATELKQIVANRIPKLKAAGLPTDQSEEGLMMLSQGNIQGFVDSVQGISNSYQQALQGGLTADQQGFRSLTQGLSEEDADKARRIKLGLDPRANISAQERVATDSQLGQQVAEQKALESGAVEEGKLSKQLKWKPQIAKDIKMAEKKAIEQGDTLNELGRMEASLPGVKQAVAELLELSDMATSTLGGRAFDFLVKESGFGATKGSDARAKLIAIVDNQVLPLLKETFGAAFTAQEGEALKASLVDPDASPSQKREQLNAFLAQKERNIRAKQAQVDNNVPSPQPQVTPTQVIRFDAQGNMIQ
jgi:hypothetical protein